MNAGPGKARMLEIVREYWLQILVGNFPNGPLGGIALTLLTAVGGLLLALPTGIVLALCLTSTCRWVAAASTALVFYMRSVPLIMHLLWIHYLVLPVLTGRPWSGFSSVLVTLVIFNGAYLSQSIRAGIQALPRGQYEAARALGFGHLQTMCRVVGPQALRNVTPSIVGQLVILIKETSLGSLIGMAETTQQFLDLNDRLGNRPLEVFALLALTFFAMCYPLTLAGRWLERLYARPGGRAAPAATSHPPRAPAMEGTQA